MAGVLGGEGRKLYVNNNTIQKYLIIIKKRFRAEKVVSGRREKNVSGPRAAGDWGVVVESWNSPGLPTSSPPQGEQETWSST